MKPFIPKPLRFFLRRIRVPGLMRRNAHLWPIDPQAVRPPADWAGWPHGKKFAFVLTHDVESGEGQDKTRRLAELEMANGFRSSFNFIPEGSYEDSAALRQWLGQNGFEVGVHDLKHDGRLYESRAAFDKNAERINRYLYQWGAVGFRSGFMLRELDWLHELNIVYDASTFDTDPFEPQPEGAHTIFPFRVAPPPGSPGPGYIELPYTLPQDSTLFLLLREKTPAIWKHKLDWVARHGGLALVNIHPDYLDFSGGGDTSTSCYPVALLKEFLDYVRHRHGETFWNPVPRDLALWFRNGADAAPVDLSSRATTSSPPLS